MSAGSSNPFQPAATVSLTAGTASSNIQLAGGGECVLVTNATSALAYIRFGSDPTVQATVIDTPVLPASRILLRCGPLVTYCAAILSSGSGAVLFTRGDGSST
jgi:hypothetical protein